MSFLTIFGALLLEYLHPLVSSDGPRLLIQNVARALEKSLNAGERFHGALAWTVVAVPIVAIGAIVHAVLGSVSFLLALAWDVVILYLCMGFKQDTHVAASVARALREGDPVRAREFAMKIGVGGETAMPMAPLVAQTVEALLDRAQRQVFGVLTWFVILLPLGPAGALLYRAGNALADEWTVDEGSEAFGDFARTAQRILQWLPARLTAASFAVAGNFEDAMYGWRSQGPEAAPRDIVIGAAGGALGVKLGAAESGDEVEPDDLESAVGLIWRAVLLWLAVAFLFALGGWLNG